MEGAEDWSAVSPLHGQGLESAVPNYSCSKQKSMRRVAEQSTDVIPLSIAIPAYNRRGSVEVLLKSICEQAQPEDEVIVSDDGSTDGTSEYCAGIPGVRAIRHDTNQGMVANWNTCLKSATRDWICLVHDDDRLGPGAVGSLRRACALAARPALILHKYAGTRSGDGFRCHYYSPSSWAVLNCPTIPSGGTVHRTVIDQVGLFDTRFKYSADMEYFPRIVAEFPLLVIESPRIVEYRIHGANYQLQTWREPDFYDQLETLHRTIISYADIQHEEVKRNILEQRMVGNLFYMLKMADRFGDRALVRQAGEYF